MNTITIEGFIFKSPYGTYTHASCDMAEHGYVLIGPHNIEFEIPADFNPVAAEVAALEKKLDTLNDEHQQKVAAIKSRIKDLQCIGYTPAEEMPDVVSF